MADLSKDGAWFAPKRFGYGAGLPIVWQGWAMLITHAAATLVGLAFFKASPVAAFAWILIVAVLPLPLYAAKTRGGWKWRWGGSD